MERFMQMEDATRNRDYDCEAPKAGKHDIVSAKLAEIVSRSAVLGSCLGTSPILYGDEVGHAQIQIAAIQLVAAVLALTTAALTLLPALGKAIRHIKEKRRKR